MLERIRNISLPNFLDRTKKLIFPFTGEHVKISISILSLLISLAAISVSSFIPVQLENNRKFSELVSLRNQAFWIVRAMNNAEIDKKETPFEKLITLQTTYSKFNSLPYGYVEPNWFSEDFADIDISINRYIRHYKKDGYDKYGYLYRAKKTGNDKIRKIDSYLRAHGCTDVYGVMRAPSRWWIFS